LLLRDRCVKNFISFTSLRSLREKFDIRCFFAIVA
jgi:hypothetical protein